MAVDNARAAEPKGCCKRQQAVAPFTLLANARRPKLATAFMLVYVRQVMGGVAVVVVYCRRGGWVWGCVVSNRGGGVERRSGGCEVWQRIGLVVECWK